MTENMERVIVMEKGKIISDTIKDTNNTNNTNNTKNIKEKWD